MVYREKPIYICGMNEVDIFKALSNKTRLDILNWLKDPANHFDKDGFGENGVCVGQIQKKAGITQSTVSEYLSVLQRAGLVTAKRVGQWTYYQRNEEAMQELGAFIKTEL